MSKDKKVGACEQAVYESTREDFLGWMRAQARAALEAVFEQELLELCGSFYGRGLEREVYRAGSAPTRVLIHGRREEFVRPRARRVEGGKSREVRLKSLDLARDGREWEEAMMRALLGGMSLRKALELEGSRSRSALSRLWKAKAAEMASAFERESLEDFDLLALMLDGVRLDKELVATVALGIDTQGRKRILGYRIGGSESEPVCQDLLANLQERGLRAPHNRRLLAVLDGSKALRAALLKAYPGALIQRCLVHKERNLRGYLSRKHWGELARHFARLRKAQGRAAAQEEADAIGAFLADKNAQARQSLAEAGDELLALFAIQAPNTTHVSLLSTNCIENAFKNLRRHIGRVSRWSGKIEQAEPWVATGLIIAQRGFRAIRGVQDLPALIAALEKSHAAAAKEKQVA